jgi:ectoine hydroxylase-related dioxygenase (phytanoyl-CoA dioxygenase family)
MNDIDQYLFDLYGYLVVKNLFSAEEVKVLNQVIDRQLPQWNQIAGADYIHTGMDEETMSAGNSDPKQGPVDFYGGLILDWGQPIRDLVGHKKLMPYLVSMIGTSLRLDHQYAILVRKSNNANQMHLLHGGNTPYDSSQSYHVRNEQIYAGLTVASIALTDASQNSGGFCCIPGSHKNNFQLPPRFIRGSNHPSFVKQIPLKAGDVLFFTEALTHGTLKWQEKHERRALLFKYCPAHMQWEKNSPFLPKSKEYKWSKDQKKLFVKPFFRID